MRPDVNDLLSGVALALRDFAFVMGEDIVHAAGMNVESRAEILD